MQCNRDSIVALTQRKQLYSVARMQPVLSYYLSQMIRINR
jgi:hypothetical protein